jgi:biopolymer transport protein ExbD
MGRHKAIKTGLIDPDLPITPMLDMSFQLLAFFLTTFNPSPTEGHLDLALPKQEGAQASQTLPDTLKIDEDDEFTVQVEATPEGNIAGIKVLEKGSAEAKPLGSETSKLFQYLKERAAKKAAVGKLRLEIGEALNYQFVVKLIDEATRAGYTQVSPTLFGGGTK